MRPGEKSPGGSPGLPRAAGGTRPLLALGIWHLPGYGSSPRSGQAHGKPHLGDPVAGQRMLDASIIGAGMDIPKQGLKWHPGQCGEDPQGAMKGLSGLLLSPSQGSCEKKSHNLAVTKLVFESHPLHHVYSKGQ